MSETLLPFVGKAILVFLGALGVSLGITIGLKIIVRFDFNKWQQDRLERQKEKLRTLCPHMDIVGLGDKSRVEYWFIRTDTHTYRCGRCGTYVHNPEEIENHNHLFLNNPDLLKKQVKAYLKQHRKIYGR